jgi:serine phosphatase RsbU (regulator of sigma subunit)
MTYAVVDVRARTMTYARAGHTPLIYAPAAPDGQRLARVLAPDGLVLGLKIDDGQMFERILEEETIPLQPGDLLSSSPMAFRSHGSGRRLFRRGPPQQTGGTVRRPAADALRERVLREIATFVNGAPQHDDMTMILLKVEPGVDQASVPRSVPVAMGSLGEG